MITWWQMPVLLWSMKEPHILSWDSIKSASVLEELDELIPKLPEAQKDDIQILRGNLRAQLYIDEGNLEQAEYELETAKELLNTDDVEYSLNKDVY